MKVLLVNTYHYPTGGPSTYTFNLASLLREKGHDVAFFAMADPRNLPDPNADLFVSNIDFSALNRRRSPAAAARVLMRVAYSVEARRKFARIVERFSPDLVHLNAIHAHITPSIVLEAKKRGLPVVWTLHDYKLICPNSHFMMDATEELCEACGSMGYYRAVLKRCKKGSLIASAMATIEAYTHYAMGIRGKIDAYLALSQFQRNKLLERGFPEGKVHHVPNFVPSDLFKRTDSDRGYLLYLGGLRRIKGINELLDACRSAPSTRVVLAGGAVDGPPCDSSEWLPPNAEYVGVVTGSKLSELIAGALAVIVPSLTYESSPHAVLEAFAHGKALIGSDTGGIAEVLKHRERGLLVPRGDVPALAEAMRWIAANAAEARRMGTAAYEYALATHSKEPFYSRLMDIYESVH